MTTTTTPTTTHHGSCLCGGITFTLAAEPQAVSNCFCPDCRKNASGPCQTCGVFPGSALTLADPEGLETMVLVHGTGSGKPKEKWFCKRCGCTLWTVPDGIKAQGLRVVRLGLVDGGLERWTPTVELFSERRPKWMNPVEGARQVIEAKI